MPIESVVIGRGRTLKFWKDKNSTRWSIRLWPIGAFVHLKGSEENNVDQKTFVNRPFWQRALTILAGPLINFAILPILFLGFYLIVGQPSTPAVLVGIHKGLAAEKAGLQVGDRFLAVDGIPLTNFQDMWRIAYAKGPVESVYTIQRGEEVFDMPFTPGWIEFTDDDGIDRQNARFGVTWQHAPFKLSAIMSVNGKDTQKNEDLARKQLVKNLGKTTKIGLKGPDTKPHPFTIKLSEEMNQGLLDPDHENYERVYLGASDNIYLKKSVSRHIEDAFRFSLNMVGKIATVPFQLLPIDAQVIKDFNAVSAIDTPIINTIYRYLHLFALASVVVGLVNLLPLPGLDGGQLVVQALERIKKKPMTRKQKALLFASSFFLIYFSILFSNLDNLPGYIDSRTKKVQEFINQSSQEKESAGDG